MNDNVRRRAATGWHCSASVAALMLATLLLSACAPTVVADPSASPAPSSRPTAVAPASETAGPSPTTSAESVTTQAPAPMGSLADTIGIIVVTDLVVRSAPSVGESSAIFELGLGEGDLVYVIDGPMTADGYEWLLVSEMVSAFAPGAAGWIAKASREGEEWVRPVTPDCPAEVTTAAFAAAPPQLLLKCFGTSRLTLDGALGYCAHGDPVVQEPEWLANSFCSFEVPGRPAGVSEWPSMLIRLPDGLDVHGAGEELQAVRITGSFDSPLARTCRYKEDAAVVFPGLGELDEQLLRFNCRHGFVVESATVLGR